MGSLRNVLQHLTTVLLATSAACGGGGSKPYDHPTGGGCGGPHPMTKEVVIDPPLQAELDACSMKPACPAACKLVLGEGELNAQCTVEVSAIDATKLIVTYKEYMGCAGRRPTTAERGERVIETAGELLARQAELEARSVGAFEDLASALEAHGAPGEIVRLARESARDEIDHAERCTRMAAQFGATPDATTRVVAALPTLEALAIDNAVEGEVRELYGAAVATWQARAANREDVREMMRAIAVDETKHAELALRIGAWARTRLSERAVARVEAAKRAAIAELVAGAGAEPPQIAVRELGMPGAGDAQRLLAGLVERVWN